LKIRIIIIIIIRSGEDHRKW